MSALTVEAALQAGRWEDLGLPRTKQALRSARLALHPDVNPAPGASDAFARLEILFAAPEFKLRVAHGFRGRDTGINWTAESGFTDLLDVALRAHRDLEDAKHRRFFPRVTPATSRADYSMYTRYGIAGKERWWFLNEFPDLDGRTVVWVAKRLAAALVQAQEAGWVHGDVNPATVAIQPAEHGLQLDGWWYGVKHNERVTVRPTSPHTPPRYLSGSPADIRLSVAQGAGMLKDKLRAGEPEALKSMLAENTIRPGMPDRFFANVESVAKRVYGGPSWHPLAEPGVSPI